MARRIEMIRLPDIKEAVRNPKDHSIPALVASISRFGFVEGITRDDRTNRLVAGHGRVFTLRALRKEGRAPPAGVVVDDDGEWMVPVQVGWASKDDAEAEAYIIASNRTVELGGWHQKALDEMLLDLGRSGVDALVGTGFGTDDLDDIIARSGVLSQHPDDVPGLPKKPWVKLGDRFALGEHVLTCGDCREPANLAGEKAVCMWTDPPYGVNYVGGTKEKKKILNDDPEGLPALLKGAFASANQALTPGAAVYVAHPAGPLSLPFMLAFVGAGWRLHETLVWVKDSFALGHSDYHYRHEPILYGYTDGGGRRGRGGAGWHGGADQASVFEVPKPKRNGDHPTMKPVELIVQMLKNSSARGEWVIDPFGGSGSTLIACEALGRRCRTTELDPGYAQVIVERWQKYTGQKAERLDPVTKGQGDGDAEPEESTDAA